MSRGSEVDSRWIKADRTDFTLGLELLTKNMSKERLSSEYWFVSNNIKGIFKVKDTNSWGGNLC